MLMLALAQSSAVRIGLPERHVSPFTRQTRRNSSFYSRQRCGFLWSLAAVTSRSTADDTSRGRKEAGETWLHITQSFHSLPPMPSREMYQTVKTTPVIPHNFLTSSNNSFVSTVLTDGSVAAEMTCCKKKKKTVRPPIWAVDLCHFSLTYNCNRWWNPRWIHQ